MGSARAIRVSEDVLKVLPEGQTDAAPLHDEARRHGLAIMVMLIVRKLH